MLLYKSKADKLHKTERGKNMTKVLLTEKRVNKDNNLTYEQLNMKVVHINGLYRFSVSKETITEENGFISTQFIPFAGGNFNYTITSGRKSQKKLDTLNQIIEDNQKKLVDFWKNAQYQAMCGFLKDIAVLKKIA